MTRPHDHEHPARGGGPRTLGGLDLGTFGIWTFDLEFLPAARVREVTREIERQGWRALWVPELFGREALTHAGFLLAATEHLHVINGIAGIWSREAQWAQAGAVLLADAYPDRHVLGLGVGGGRPDMGSPLAAMGGYLDELDAASSPNPEPAAPVRRVLAAYGPKMLAMARDRALGAHTYKVNVAHTREAREILGPDPYLAVEHAVLLESDPIRARELAREHLFVYLNTPFNIAKFRRLGYADDELLDGGSDRLVDDLVFWGDLDTVAGRLREHVDAGADHVGIQIIGTDPGSEPSSQWQQLADALLPDTTATPRSDA